ncbi:hypothetical protein GCM10009855_03420 [Gordonia cholesterolivorans]|uniref:Uncharacterized protein n=1 Tax=Gordonia cholesterolivorans TaxID=559625 RepID=A0ABN3H232_9ACTN
MIPQAAVSTADLELRSDSANSPAGPPGALAQAQIPTAVTIAQTAATVRRAVLRRRDGVPVTGTRSGDLGAQLTQRGRQKTRDVHLRDTHSARDVAL